MKLNVTLPKAQKPLDHGELGVQLRSLVAGRDDEDVLVAKKGEASVGKNREPRYVYTTSTYKPSAIGAKIDRLTGRRLSQQQCARDMVQALVDRIENSDALKNWPDVAGHIQLLKDKVAQSSDANPLRILDVQFSFNSIAQAADLIEGLKPGEYPTPWIHEPATSSPSSQESLGQLAANSFGVKAQTVGQGPMLLQAQLKPLGDLSPAERLARQRNSSLGELLTQAEQTSYSYAQLAQCKDFRLDPRAHSAIGAALKESPLFAPVATMSELAFISGNSSQFAAQMSDLHSRMKNAALKYSEASENKELAPGEKAQAMAGAVKEFKGVIQEIRVKYSRQINILQHLQVALSDSPRLARISVDSREKITAARTHAGKLVTLLQHPDNPYAALFDCATAAAKDPEAAIVAVGIEAERKRVQ